MIYPWVFPDFNITTLRQVFVDIIVGDTEEYEDKDTPNKQKFVGNWRNWQGVEVSYRLNNELTIGYRGKTVWYIPIMSEHSANIFGHPIGTGVKIIKYPL